MMVAPRQPLSNGALLALRRGDITPQQVSLDLPRLGRRGDPASKTVMNLRRFIPYALGHRWSKHPSRGKGTARAEMISPNKEAPLWINRLVLAASRLLPVFLRVCCKSLFGVANENSYSR